eukprot:jgi/Galph1/1305/GphlegSOOS_G6106.1
MISSRFGCPHCCFPGQRFGLQKQAELLYRVKKYQKLSSSAGRRKPSMAIQDAFSRPSNSEDGKFGFTDKEARLTNAEKLLEEARMQRWTYVNEKSKNFRSSIDKTTGRESFNGSGAQDAAFEFSSKTNVSSALTSNTQVTPDQLLRESLSPWAPRYDPTVATAYFKTRALDVRKRQIRITVPIMLFVSKIILDWQRGLEKKNRRKRAKEFLSIIASLGPAFIKGGQALSSRPDYYLRNIWRNYKNCKIVEPEPVAVASIGQVYKAYLKNGEAVAVKVQRPECEKVIALDIYILRQLSGTLSKALKMLRRDINLQSVIEEFGKLIYEEIDYISEGRNAERFRQLYSNIPDVYIPKIHWEWTRDKVLTMEWIEGTRLTDTEKYGLDASKLIETMVRCSLKQMLEYGYFHADPHGGNLMATKDGKLCYLDFGMMSELKPSQRYGIIEAVVHMVNRDFQSLARLYVRLGFLPEGTDLNPIVEALKRALPDVLGASVGN